jgi:hypothetical protein
MSLSDLGNGVGMHKVSIAAARARYLPFAANCQWAPLSTGNTLAGLQCGATGSNPVSDPSWAARITIRLQPKKQGVKKGVLATSCVFVPFDIRAADVFSPSSWRPSAFERGQSSAACEARRSVSLRENESLTSGCFLFLLRASPYTHCLAYAL